MEIIYFTVAGIFVYIASDAILDRIEQGLGNRLPYRSVFFFAIMMAVALAVFALFRTFITPPV
ncbi:MAG: hypothetical protein OQJ99_03680 [Rhodospirillales bacterium]|nr:hypothetical protein [Rhodospirillales bacterium]MCW8862551.1 hypothetical protein [Rhodospirillales bacterium]MCW8951455.1 hypothetical protein [Rhodospirillales bacterium]MCW8970339.1 hypothetical protein [Rhodospirillales bacterium]MCW9001184.1 hypothetical protein [Rhodospirillales bacterium]